MRRLLQIGLVLGFLALLGGVFGGALFYALILRDLPEIESLADYRPLVGSRVLAADGTELASFYKERRVVVPIEDVPEHTVQAFIAAEDAAFYEHEGLDYPGILRAFLKNLQAGSVQQGGSTITQQVAKTFLLTSERSYIRKLKDMVLARRIEKSLDKNEILHLYLNQIYLGSGAYGIGAAAKTYFDKPVGELTLAESALIAGLVPRPSFWSPLVDPDTARAKQRLVLSRMVRSGFITEATREAAIEEPLVFARDQWDERVAASAHFVEEIRRYAMRRFGADRVLTEGLTIQTTLALDRQRNAWKAVRRGLRNHDRRGGWRGPLRNVPEEEWAELIVELGEEHAEPRQGDDNVVRALITSVDDSKGEMTLLVAPEVETTLTLEDVAWAREPNPELDGNDARWHLKKLGKRFRVGDLVQLERTLVPGGSDDPLAPPEYRYALYQEPLAEGALVAIDLPTGELEALVGGYSFERSQFNRAVQSRRQPGSAFKPIIYAAALERGLTPATIIYDTPIVYVDDDTGFEWKPQNYSYKFYGPITLRQALAASRNIATIKLLRDVGLGPVIRLAERLGIHSNLEDNLGLALGNSEVTLAEIVRAYSAFAAGGKLIDPVFIREIRDREGEVLASEVRLMASQLETPDIAQGESLDEIMPADEVERIMQELRDSVDDDEGGPNLPEGHALDRVTAFLMTDMLRAVVETGTGRRVRALRRPVAGKTGTTNDLYDAWFIGFTPEKVAGAWVGYDNARNLGKNETGSRAASPIFLEYLRNTLRGQPVRDFQEPPGIVYVPIDPKTGLRAHPASANVIFQPFREGTAPQESAPVIPTESGPLRPPRID